MKHRSFLFLLPQLAGACLAMAAPVVKAPAPYGALPSQRQLAWHKLKYYGFVHYGLNTFTDSEWGYGDTPPAVFAPSGLDCRQWAKIAKEAGMEGLLITAKHHDGFCLWPTRTSDYSIQRSPWKGGQGDVIKELRAACDEYGLKLGIYLSPWDRHDKAYGTPAYRETYRAQLRELASGYGEIFEFWFDGANGGDGYYGGTRGTRRIDPKSYYRWPQVWQIVRALQPLAVMFSDGGPDIRWIGNEDGRAGDPNWCTVRPGAFYPGIRGASEQQRSGHEDGGQWLPAEVNTSIRPGWFYHAREDSAQKPLGRLVDCWYRSVGMNGSFILNIPADRRGLFHENDAARLRELKAYLDAAFADDLARAARVTASNVRGEAAEFAAGNVSDGDPETYWATDDAVKTATIEFDFAKEIEVNGLLLRETIALGQRIKGFTIGAMRNGTRVPVYSGITIGNRRLVRFANVKTRKLTVRFQAKACPLISTIEIYRSPDLPEEGG